MTRVLTERGCIMISIRRVLLCSLALSLSVVMSCTQEPLSIDSSDPSQVTRISQAPYRYQDATYWTLANGCTYSRGISGGGGWRYPVLILPFERHLASRTIFKQSLAAALAERRAPAT